MTETLTVAEVADAGRRRPRRGRDRSSSACATRCAPRSRRSSRAATCCSRTCPGSARRSRRAAWRPRSGLTFRRVQCTPDLLPSDITGSSVFDPATARSRSGPARCSPGCCSPTRSTGPPRRRSRRCSRRWPSGRSRSTATTYPLPAPFHVVATSNPVEYEGTYPLPEAQLDRFMVRLAVGYPERDAEVDVLSRRLARRTRRRRCARSSTPTTLLAMQAGVEAVHVDPDVAAVLRRPRRRDARARRGRGRRVAARVAGARARRAGARGARTAATSSRPRTSRPSRSRRSRTGCRSRRRRGRGGRARRASCPTCSRRGRRDRRRRGGGRPVSQRDRPWARAARAARSRGSSSASALLVVGALAGRPDVAVLGAAPVVARRLGLATAAVARRRVHVARVRRPSAGGRRAAGVTPVQRVARRRRGAASGVRRGTQRHRRGARARRRHPRAAGRGAHGADRPAGRSRTSTSRASAPGAASVSEAVRPRVAHRAGPARDPTARRLPLPPRLRGLTGAHESRRPGEGGGLRDVHPYAPGDRLRRIDWRVTARRAPDLHELYVRREHALAEAVVMLVVDSRDDVGPDPTTWRGSTRPRREDPTSLDLARQAAASVAQAFLGHGRPRRASTTSASCAGPLPPGGGRRQLDAHPARARAHAPRGRAAAPACGRRSSRRARSSSCSPRSSTTRPRRSPRRGGAPGTGWSRSTCCRRVREAHLADRERLALRLIRIAREDRLAGARGRRTSSSSRGGTRRRSRSRGSRGGRSGGRGRRDEDPVPAEPVGARGRRPDRAERPGRARPARARRARPDDARRRVRRPRARRARPVRGGAVRARRRGRAAAGGRAGRARRRSIAGVRVLLFDAAVARARCSRSSSSCT